MDTKKIIAASLVLAAAATATAETFVAPSFGFATNRVESGTVTQSDRVTISPEGRLYKQGSGTWVLPAATIPQEWPANITVSEGTLEFQSGGAAPTAPTGLSQSVMDKALLWVDAADTNVSHFRNGTSQATCGSSGYITAWYDKRETNIDTPTYAYARSVHDYISGNPKWNSITRGRVVNFGDVTNSGVAMEWVLPSGSR